MYMMFLSNRIDKRFAGRRWNIPSRVYSDTILMYKGQQINPALFVEKLTRLGYRKTDRSPEHQGEMQVSGRRINIYLHDFHSPIYNQQSRPVQISLQENRVADITNQDTNSSMSLLELEPEELMLYYGPDRERRRLISVRKIPSYVIHAVLAAEDRDFYRHKGIKLSGILRALIVNLRAGSIRQGGSTITQQLAKNYFLTPERTYSRKFKELLIAIILEHKFDKNDILEIYMNEIYCGQQGSVAISGIGEAARFYFDKEASELSVAQAATIAGLIRGPNLYSPYKNPGNCLKRRNIVLSAMQQEGWLKADEYKAASITPIKTAGFAAPDRRAPYFMDYLTDQLTELYSSDALSSEGLSIYTTIDTQVQAAAEKALARGLSRLEAANPALKRSDPKKRLQGAIIVMQPKTGYIITMTGGRDYSVSQFNRAVQAMRQPGSAFKPFVYLTALDTYTAVSKLSNIPKTYMVDNKPWEPKNFSKNAASEVTFREAFAESQNIATINLAFAVGLDRIADTADAFHLSVTRPPYPSMVLGAQEVTPLMLARSYCAFAADGFLPFPLTIREIVDEAGKVVENRHTRIERLISPAKAYIMSDLMRSVVNEGTARSLKYEGIEWPVAGKTGTTNDSKDAWFVGYTPDILALVWVGFDNGDSIKATGAGAAMPIWADMMKMLPQYVSGEWFAVPSGVITCKICKDSGLLAQADCCPETTDEVFLSETAPAKTCDQHHCFSPFKRILEGVKKIVPIF
uniref:Uncharacterized protein n=1 Tax=uncultured Desulfobacterium sp. TaxID=201089 RepID=E1YBB8_9BACT|nr:hypothetical protein N47_C18530 [uncultured Desulfobacterium sp.]